VGKVSTRTGKAPRTWLFRYQWGATWVRLTIGHHPQMGLADARGRAQELRRALDDGIDPRRARPRRQRGRARAALPTVATLAPDDRNSIAFLVHEFTHRYLRVERRRPEQAESMLALHVLPEWGERDALLNAMVARGKPTSANRTASLLGLMFRFGVQQHIVDASPVQLLMPPGGHEKPRNRVLSEDELRVWLADPHACIRKPWMVHAVTVLLLTGQRKGELAKARWHQVDLAKRIWTIPEDVAKNECEHLVPLSSWAVDELQWLKRWGDGSPWVMPMQKEPARHLDPHLISETVRRSVGRLRKQGIAPFRPHDLRRTVRTNLSRLRVEPHIAERVINHRQSGPYDLWAYLDDKREALERWAAYLEGLKPATPADTAP
jgi:integrase